MFRNPLPFLVLSGAVIVSGCATQAPAPETAEAVESAGSAKQPGQHIETQNSSLVADVPVEPEVPEAGGGVQTGGVSASVPIKSEVTEAPPPAPTPVPAPASLVGKDVSGLRLLFGNPSFVRVDEPAQLWRYATEGCALYLFLYDDGTDAYHVSHLEFRGTGRSLEEKEACLRSVITARQENTAS